MITFVTIASMGLTTGILSGLLGIGGGVVLVPMMVFILGISQHVAQGISMLVIIPTAIVGIIHFSKDKLVDFRIAGYLAFGAIIGALISSNLAQYISAASLKRLFGIFVIYSGIKMFVAKQKKD